MQIVGNVRRQVQQIAKKEQEAAEAKEAAEHEKLKVWLHLSSVTLHTGVPHGCMQAVCCRSKVDEAPTQHL